MTSAIQNLIALVVVGFCVVFLIWGAVAKWRRLFSKGSRGCGGCGSCGSSVEEDSAKGKSRRADFVSLRKKPAE